jgi:murein L,D-transpeptidase YafK
LIRRSGQYNKCFEHNVALVWLCTFSAIVHGSPSSVPSKQTSGSSLEKASQVDKSSQASSDAVNEPGVYKDMIVLTVDKTTLRAQLSTLPENGAVPQPIRSFQIAIGKAQGDKLKRGDNKTPEGIYFTVGRIDSGKIAPEKYGPMALPINFPNPMDVLEGKTGDGIWLHGVGDRKIEDANITEGCVAFPNQEISSLVPWLKPSHGVVIVANDMSQVNLEGDLKSLYETSTKWMQSWQARQFEDYIANYSDDFVGQGKNLRDFTAHKKAVFARYKTMTVSMTGVRLVTHPKYALMMMNQDFKGDKSFKSDGRKLLYWRKNSSGEWKIVREMFDDFPMNPVQFSKDDIAGLK